MRNLLLGISAALLATSSAAQAGAGPERKPPPPPPVEEASAPSDLAHRSGQEELDDQDEPGEDEAASFTPVIAPFAIAAVSLGTTGNPLLDVVLGAAEIGTFVALSEAARTEPVPGPVEDRWGKALEERRSGYAQYYPDDEEYPQPRRRPRRREAREGVLFSFGLGGGSLHVSPDRATGAFDLGVRLGYGFSDRFQSFVDLTADSTSYGDGRDVTSYTFTLRGQTVLAGDRYGNGLNLNLGFGLGGVSRSYYQNYYGSSDSGVGVALAAGLSYDARIGRYFSLSPELYATWHQIPNPGSHPSDVASAVGFRINFLWYSR